MVKKWIENAAEAVKTEILNLKKKPAKIVFSAVIMVLMAVLTIFAWDGNTKRLVICAGLTVVSGVLILLPRLSNRVAVPLLAVYLLYVPRKIFQRMELPTQDMSRLLDGAELLTVLLILCVFLLIFLFTQNSAVALSVGSGFFLILFLVEYYIWKFRGDFLMPSDLKAAGTAMSVMRNYQYDLSPEALYSVLYMLSFIVLGARIRIRMHKWVHVGVSLFAMLCIGGWYYVVMETPEPLGKELVIHYWDMPDTRYLDGVCLSYALLVKDSKIDVPDEYSVKRIQSVAGEAEEKYVSRQRSREDERRPDIIMIMSEAWSDLRALGEISATEDYMPFVNSLTENTLRGDLYVSILGGLTANTEFEALTGNSLSLLAPAVIPYQNQVQHDMPSLARVLEKQGYETMAMHPSGVAAWSRGKVYPWLGFDEFIHQGVWEVPYGYVRWLISDACNFNEIIHRYENRNQDAPFFLFDVTIQNHGGYYSGEVPVDVDVVKIGEIPADEAGCIDDLQTYINLMKISDDAFRELVTYFEQVDTPVIICIFGDHQPLLGDNIYEAAFAGSGLSEQENNLKKYVVPYCIWANYEVDWEAYGDMSANYLPAALLECAGLELPAFYKYLMELHEEYPVLTMRGCLDKDGTLVNIKDIWDSEPIVKYRMLQYNQLYVEDYQKEIFEEVRSSSTW